jgi:1-deoxy-D-xylulose-5-phosphate synthase
VIDARFVKPLDEKMLLEAARRCGRLVVVEENSTLGGLGSAVLELLAARNLATPVRLVGLPDRYLEHGSSDALRRSVGLSAEGVVAAAREMLSARSQASEVGRPA